MNSDIAVVSVVSGVMLFKLTKTMQNTRSLDFSSDSFDNIVQNPLQIATYLCLAVYLFNCGRHKNRDAGLQGRGTGIPVSLMMAMFSTGAAPFTFYKKETNFNDKLVGTSLLYGLYLAGTKMQSKSIPMSDIIG